MTKVYHLIIYMYMYMYVLYIYKIETQSKCTKRWKQGSAIKQLLEALFLAIKICTGFIFHVHWLYKSTFYALILKYQSITFSKRQFCSVLLTPNKRWNWSSFIYIVYIRYICYMYILYMYYIYIIYIYIHKVEWGSILNSNY